MNDNVPYSSQKVKELGNQLKAEGLTPFDLLTWECLLRMCGDLEVTSIWADSIKRQFIEAAKRKAAVLNAEQNTDFYTDVLRSWKIE